MYKIYWVWYTYRECSGKIAQWKFLITLWVTHFITSNKCHKTNPISLQTVIHIAHKIPNISAIKHTISNFDIYWRYTYRDIALGFSLRWKFCMKSLYNFIIWELCFKYLLFKSPLVTPFVKYNIYMSLIIQLCHLHKGHYRLFQAIQMSL